MTMLARVNPKTITAARRVIGSLRSTRGHCTSDGASPRARRRRSTHAPNGIRNSPTRKTAGSSRQKRMPAYGFVCSPSTSARNTIRKRMALIVVSTIPATAIGLRIRRTSLATHVLRAGDPALLLQGRQVGDERIDVVLRERVGLHLR